MNTIRKEILGAKFRNAGSSGKKAHVITRQGHWEVFKEGSEKILSEFPKKSSAISFGKKILKAGKAEALVIHKTDGSVDKIQLAG